MSFDKEQFVADCLRAAGATDPVAAVREVLAAAIADPAAIDTALGSEVGGDFGILHASDELTLQRIVFPAGYSTGLHEHRLWALLAVYAGTERHEIYRVAGDRLEAEAVREHAAGGIEILSPEHAHSSSAVGTEHLRGFHVYLGNLFATDAGEWDEPDGKRRPFSDAWLERLIVALGAAGLVADASG